LARTSQGTNEKHTIPTLFRFVNKVYHVEGIGVLLLKRINLFTEKDVLLGEVGEEKCELCLVGFVGESMGQDLVERRADRAIRLELEERKKGRRTFHCHHR
jgi:hypothetical protein